ncbi:Spy0128 family protein [Enterococcus sp.]|uniref:Spy0128 family protein n=1 Tax=Enterococcus sp. TaxID=35783 RepID=UPI00290F2F43|nr:FctA domain-containing protein [Enterococcus sp.]MDU5336826.1 FctA domain-containing protein [Enterococcus sp.]
MNRLKKIWSLSAIVGMMLSSFPMSIFAETIESADVVINQALITDTSDQEITESNRVKHKDEVKLKLNWSLAEATLVEENTIVAVDLPDNLNFPDQSGSLAEMGNYQVSNQQLVFQFKKNYEETEDGRAPEFTSAKFYEGILELTAETIAEDLETENVDFGNNTVSTIYYDKKVDPAADPLTEVNSTQEKLEPQAEEPHNPKLNERGVKLFNDIKITDLQENEFTAENPAVKDANIMIFFKWILDDSEIIKNGDYYTYQLPEYFSVHNKVTGDLKNIDENGVEKEILGDFILEENGLLTVRFNGVAEKLSQREGTIKLKTELNIKTDTETIEIPTNITDQAGDEIKIVVPVVKPDINKKGIIESDNTVTWTIVLNEEKRDLRNVVVRDALPEGLSVWHHEYSVKDESGNWVAAPAGFIQAWQDGSDYVYKFASGIMNQTVRIVLKMKLEDKTKKEFLNKVTITGDNFIPNSSEASVSFNDKDNYKYCTDYDLNTGKFNWEVKATYTQAGGTLKDWMYSRYGDPNTANHYLLKNTIKVYDNDGSLVPGDKWSFSEDEADFKKKDGEYVYFTLKFVEKGVYKVTYSTQTFVVPTPIKTDLMNTAVITDGGNSEEITGGEKPDVEKGLGVEKIATGKDYSDNTIDWKTTLNKNRIVMKNAVITDRFALLDGSKQSPLQLIESTLKVTANDGTADKLLTKDTDYVLEKIDDDSDYSVGFIVRLIGSYATTSAQIKLEYSTHYFIDQQPEYASGALLQFNNSALVTYTGEDDKTHIDGAEVATWVDAKFSFNGIKYGKYLAKDADVSTAFSHANPFSEDKAAENSVYWTALFNTWKTTIPADTTIREELGEGQELKDLVIYDVEIASSKAEVGSLGNKWQENVDYEYSLDDGVPVIKLLKETKKTFAIFVSAKASDEYHKYKNVATMTVKDKTPLKVEGMVEKSDKTAWIDKKGVQGIGDDYRLINWSVVLNKDGHKVINPVVTDTVKLNEQTFVYDADKNVVVKVYKAAKNSSGTFVKDGPAIDFPEDRKPEITSDSAAGTQTLTINLGESIDTPYIIEYQTLLDPGIQNNELVKNSASLYGKDIQYHETTTSVTVKSTDGEGTSSGKNGSIKFKKVDEKNELITTDSAFFDLYRKDKDGNLSLIFSNIEVKGDKIIENGSEIDQLSNLRYGTYIIIESKAPDGYTKDDTEHPVVISDTQASHTFTLKNSKTPIKLSTKITLEAKKELSGRPLKADEFSFNLKGDGGVDQTKKNDVDGKVLFDEITYDKADTYEYTISEAIPAEKETGITYDNTQYKVTVTVEEKAGKLEATAVYENVKAGEVPVFKNVYRALPGSIQLEAKKELSGRPLKADEFSFNLKGDGDVDQTKKNTIDGKVLFDEITYDKADTYEYTISEAIPAEKETGVTYDNTQYKVTVTVEEKAGKLEATAVYENVNAGEVPVFKNVYKALPGSIQLEAKKELSGRPLKADEFSFNLKGDGGVEQTKKNDVDGKVLFDEITYDKAGSYKYTISEVIPAEKETGVTYDNTQYKVTVTVEEKAGKLEATAVYENVKAGEVPVFKNAYKALPGSVQLEAKKELSGRPLKADEFSFNLKGDGGVDQTKKNDVDGKVLFDQISYNKAGSYKYTISEAIPAEKETGVTYDTTQYEVTVTVEEKDGKLEASVVYEKVQTGEVPTFKNVYKALPGSIQLEAKKELSGRPLKVDEFSFNLKGDKVDQTKKNDKDGKITFDQLTYDKAGTYEYTITEAIPAEKETGVTYDTTQYEVTVTVEEKAGKLEATAVYENVKAGEIPVFKNVYKALPGSIQLEAKKELSGRPLKAEEFSFTLKGDGVDQTKKNDKDGKISFDSIVYDKTGTYEYTISETITADKVIGVTYDNTQYKVTVTVEEKAGKLEATAVYENVKAGEVPVFKNVYKALPGSIQLEAKKELSGRPLKADEFSFNLKGDGGVDQTKKNDVDGKVLFDEITYDKADTYEYTISEAIPAEKETGVTYDNTQYKVTVTVEEKAGKLEATAVYENVNAGEVPVFKNTYKALPGSIQLEAKKELNGRPLKADEFSFNLKGDGDVEQTKKNDVDGKVLFDEITYDKADTYEYTISEAIPAEKETGVTYDNTQYKVTVTVEEKDGKLEATAVYENVNAGEVPVFKNTYKALPGSIQLEAKKELSGRSLKADEFSFKLSGSGIEDTKKNDKDGKVTFDQLTYDKAGTYEYTISEAIPAEKETGITYDDTKYKVTVNVEDKSGKLEATAVYENVKAGEIPVFNNSYTPEKKVRTGEILLKKIDSKTGRTLANAEFKLVDEKGKTVAGKEKIVTGEDGSILIKGLADGDYQIIETKAPDGYLIDETPIKFSVKNSQSSKKEINQENDPLNLPKTGDSNNKTTNVHTTYRNVSGSSSTASKRLPSTGSIQNKGLIVLGLFFLAMVGLVLIGKRKKV